MTTSEVMGAIGRARALTTLRDGHERLWELIGEMDGAALTKHPAVGEWSVADLVGHIASWEELALLTIHDWKSRKELSASERLKSEGGVDRFNARQIDSKRSLSASDVMSQSHATFEALDRAIAGLTDEEWVEPSYFETTHPGEFGEILGRFVGGEAGLFSHIEDHLPELEEFTNREAWHNYLVATVDRPPSPILDRLEPHLPKAGEAIDLGCGGGRSTRWLLDRGFSVTAVDASAEAIEMVRDRLSKEAPAKLVHSRFQDLSLDTYDVTLAVFSLFFLQPGEFEEFWSRIVRALRPGGLFAGEFLGLNDDWKVRPYSLHSRDAVQGLFEGFEILDFLEEEEDGETAVGEKKHWHVFHVIARKQS